MRITSTELENWGNTRDAQGKLPLLIRKLITNSVEKYIPHIDIPTEDSIWKPGMDGIVQTKSDSILGEAGIYNIECGVNKDYQEKFSSDLNKRSEKLKEKTDGIFVFITTQKIKDKNTLVDSARQNIQKSNLWGSIKVFDADSIEHWLEQDYATAAWMCDILGKPSDGIYDFGKKWNEWCSSTIIPLDEQIILARENIYEKEINNWLLYDKGLLEVKSNSKLESLLFLLASIQKIADKEKREEIKSKVLIVEDQNQWKRIVDNKHSENLILIPMFGIPDGIAILKDKDYQIYFPLSSTDTFQIDNRIELKNVNNYLLEPILNQKFQDYHFQNNLHKRFSDGSLLLLQQLLRRTDTPLPKPEWVSKENSVLLLFLSIFSAWDNSNSKDIEIIEKVLDRNYKDIKSIILALINVEGAPIQQMEGNFQVTNPELILEYLSVYLSPELFDKFLNGSEEILNNVVQDYDANNNKNFLYDFNLDKSKERYSSQLKSAVSQGLALFSNYGNYNENNAHIPLKISRMLTKLFDKEDYKLWLSLNRYIQSLFEAAPNEMLRQVKKIFNNNNLILRKMIDNSTVCFGGDCFYVGILNGLESLAWLPEYLPKVTDTLLQMNENWQVHDGYSNSPLDSLRKIYCAWMPNTGASLEQRKEILLTYVRNGKYLESIEMLLNELQPCRNDTIIASNQPIYLNIKRITTLNTEVCDFYNFVFETLITIIDINHHWSLLIDNYFNLPIYQKNILVDKLKAINFAAYNDDEKLKIKKSITLRINWFEEFGKDANKSIDINLINELKDISDSIKFNKKYQEYISLFDVYSYQENNDIYLEALRDILHSDGINGILQLAKNLKENKHKFKDTLSMISFSKEELKQLLDAFDSDKNIDDILCYFVGRYFYGNEQDFLNNYWNNNWQKDLQKSILKLLNSSLYLWQWIEQQGLDTLYWSEINTSSNLSSEEFEYAKEKLKMYNPSALLETVFYNQRITNINDILLSLSLFQQTKVDYSKYYYIEQLFNELYKNNIDNDTLIKLEIKYLDILTAYDKPFPKILKKELSNPNSSLFVEIISELYFQDSLSVDECKKIKEKELPPEQKKAKDLALSLMMKFESTFIFDNYNDILPWFENNKKRLISLDRLVSGISVIGQIFGRSPKDENDNMWPLKIIRDIIEKEDNDDLNRAICIGKYNSIGIRSITPQATDMWNAYKEYKKYADALRYSYYRTADILDNIADDYKRNAMQDQNSFKKRYF